LEDKLREYEIIINNFKQQNLTLQCSFKNKEDTIYQLENEIDEYREKIRDSKSEINRLEEQIKAHSNEISSLKANKDELEDKVSRFFPLQTFILSFFLFENKRNLLKINKSQFIETIIKINIVVIFI
jgi:predicted nuclease with TOPRIM domain